MSIKLFFKYKPVNVKIDGKKYSIKTSKNGGAVFKITQKMVKKLKIGKKYPFHIEFGENIAKGNLIIKK